MIYFPWSSADAAAAMGLCLREKPSITNAFSFLPEAKILPFLQTRHFSNVFFVWRQDSKKKSSKK